MKGALIIAVIVSLVFISTTPMATTIYRWVDEKGNVVFSDSPPPSGSFKKQNIEDEIDKVIDQKKAVEKRSDIDDNEKFNKKIKIEIEYEKKARAIRNYRMMRDDLDTLREKYRKKEDELRSQLNRGLGWSARADLYKDIEMLRRNYEEEVRAIKNHYGYY